MKLLPEPLKVIAVVGTYTGVSIADMEILIRCGVGLATFCYIAAKTYQVLKRKRDDQP